MDVCTFILSLFPDDSKKIKMTIFSINSENIKQHQLYVFTFDAKCICLDALFLMS